MDNKKRLVEVAKELNEVLGLEPQIDLKAKLKELKQKIKEASELIDFEQDDLSKETLTVLKEVSTNKISESKVKLEEKEPPKVVEEVKTKKKPTSISLQPQGRRLGEKMLYLAKLIDQGNLTRKEIISKALREFPDISKSSFQRILSNSKNEKYNKFEKLVIQNDKGILSFKEGSK
jgi:excinuclease UvrABC nuclease subunit